MKKNIVAMIPARSGSQGLPDKNIQVLNGIPLVAHSILPALDCPDIAATYLNSDSQQYLNIGASFGAQTYYRPDTLACHVSTMQAVIADFIEALRTMGEAVDAVLVLYPTYPFRTAKQLSEIIAFYNAAEDCGSVVGFKTPDTHPFLCANLSDTGEISSYVDYDPNRYYRRQDYPSCFEFTAWAMIVNADRINELNAYLIGPGSRGFRMPDDVKVVDIDTIHDFHYAEFLVEKGYVKAYGGQSFAGRPLTVKTG
ncbi:cytidylyltransferase domain-containing protein [Roseibium sp.]|uniref:acylneuraminate cytidylyltransferase family protein n=1 Tax=Roseibium sp. TaxID=1936156 RepID=UPI003A973B16